MNRRRGTRATLRQANMSLWLWPSVAAAAAFGVGVALGSITLGEDSFATTFFKADVSAARAVLAALVGGLVTAFSVVFSLAITALQAVHARYSPRLLRNFMRDSGTKITLGVFAGSVAYMLAVLQQLPASDSSDPVPRLAVVVAMALFMACVGVVAFFTQHITHSIRVHKVMQRVVDECHRSIDLAAHTFSRSSAHSPPDSMTQPADETAITVVAAERSGYVQEIDLDKLADFAKRAGVVLRLAPVIGDQVMAGTPLAWVTPHNANGNESATYHRGVNDHVEVGLDRSMDTDIAYSLRQLVDVAVRAMSPSTNDPYTAMQALDHLTMLLCRLAHEDMADGVRRDRDGTLLVQTPVLGLEAYVRLACDQPRRYGGHEPAVAMRLLKLLRNVASRAPDRMQPALRSEIDRVLEHAERHMTPEDDLDPIRVEAETARRWAAGELTTIPEASFVRL